MSEATAAGGRPKRTIRMPAKYVEPDSVAIPAAPRQKRKIADTDSKAGNTARNNDSLEFILNDPKSPLTNIDISDLLNATTWCLLSSDARARLCTLLPPTAFADYEPTVDASHPSRRHAASSGGQTSTSEHAADAGSAMQVDAAPGARDERNPELALFSDAHFESAARTFQDHLYSGWMTDAHRDLVASYQKGVHDATTHAPWKDEVWEEQNPSASVEAPAANSPAAEASNAQAEGSCVRLADLAQHGVIKPGDVLAYKRNFKHANLPTTVEKDAIIHSIHPKTHALVVLATQGPAVPLPPALLAPQHDLATETAADNVREMTITSPTQLETTLLDLDGRIERAKRPNGNAWKQVSVWRWAGSREPDVDADVAGLLERGGRECYGTLFYLRGCYYHER